MFTFSQTRSLFDKVEGVVAGAGVGGYGSIAAVHDVCSPQEINGWPLNGVLQPNKVLPKNHSNNKIIGNRECQKGGAGIFAPRS